ncbi:MAG: CHAT domain-containing protein [Bacteroidetes bacterium]|nr:CHAT domain-containing protein [Bacteroidota bacterium]
MKYLKIFIFWLFCTNLNAQKCIDFWQKGNKVASVDATSGLNFYTIALNEARKADQKVWQAVIMADLCGSYYNLGEYQKALTIGNDGLKLLQKNQIKNDTAIFRLESSVAPCYHKLYRTQEASDSYDKAGVILMRHPEIKSKSPLFVTYYYVNYAYFLIDLFDIEKAEVMLSQASYISRGLKNPVHYARVIGLMANLYAFSGEYQKGVDQYLELEKLLGAKAFIYREELARAHYMLGYFYTKLSRPKEAIVHYNISEKYGKNLKGAFDYYYMSEIDKCENLLKLGKSEEVIKLLNVVPENTDNFEIKYYRSMAYGACFEFLQNHRQALKYYEAAFKVLIPDVNPKNFNAEKISPHKLKLFEVVNKIGTNYQKNFEKNRQSSDLDMAYLFKIKTIQMGKQIRQFQENIESKVFFTHKYHDIYKDLIKLGFYKVYFKPDDKKLIREVFNYAEEAKSVVLTDPFLLKNSVRNQKSDSLLVKIQANQSYLSYLKSQHDKKLNDEIRDYESKVQELWSTFTKLNKKLSGRILSNPDEIELPSKTIYVNYFLIGNELFAFCKNPGQEWMRKIILNRSEFDYHINNLRKELVNPPTPYEGFAASGSSRYLYDYLIGKVIHGVASYEKIILNPDHSFFDISFDVLENKKDAKQLIETHALSYASSLQLTRQKPTHIEWSVKKWIALFPFAKSSENLISGLKPLRYSTADVKGIRSENYYNEQASKRLFIDRLQHNSGNPLIIATHASSNNTEDPFLYFKSEKGIDTRLFASEIRHFDISTPMVVLSACATHRGKTFGGLGAKSFATAIHWAGCPSVAATLWEVDDESMSVLTSLFYKNLLDGLPKDQALRNAKLSYLKTSVGKSRDLPFYWAHFQIIGSTEPIVSPWEIYLPYLLALFFGLNLIWIFRKKLFFKP